MYFLSASSDTIGNGRRVLGPHYSGENGRQAGQAGVKMWWDLGGKELPASQLSSVCHPEGSPVLELSLK